MSKLTKNWRAAAVLAGLAGGAVLCQAVYAQTSSTSSSTFDPFAPAVPTFVLPLPTVVTATTRSPVRDPQRAPVRSDFKS